MTTPADTGNQDPFSRLQADGHYSANDLLQALEAFRRGDFSARLPADGSGVDADCRGQGCSVLQSSA